MGDQDKELSELIVKRRKVLNLTQIRKKRKQQATVHRQWLVIVLWLLNGKLELNYFWLTCKGSDRSYGILQIQNLRVSICCRIPGLK